MRGRKVIAFLGSAGVMPVSQAFERWHFRKFEFFCASSAITGENA
jgi:hypothetical protein